MFAIIFALGVIAAHVTAELPSYIYACSRKDSNYNQCIANGINNVKDKLCTGIPEVDIPQSEPVHFDKIVIFEANNVKLHLTDLNMYGLCNFTIKSVETDLEKLHFDLTFLYKSIFMDTTYDFDIRLLVPISHKGHAEITTGMIELKIGMDLQVTTRKGKKYIFVSKAHSSANDPLFRYKFNENEEDLTELQPILDDFVNKNRKEISKVVKLTLEEKASNLTISIFNKIAFSNYERLFSEI